MKFTFAWLKEHLETEAPLETICDTLSMIGFEVESVEDKAASLAAFKVATVKEARQHPNADRLRVCIVDTGEAEVQVVCGAPNARTGMKGIFAPAGSYIPGTDLKLKAGKIRGEASNGMLLSEREVGLSDEHDGIIEVPEDSAVGTPLAEILGLDDATVEIAITPNRGDGLGVHGIARDLAAAGLGTLKPLNEDSEPGLFESPLRWLRDLPAEAQDACPFVVGRCFRGVKNGPSPKWLQDRLKAIGLRPISALVDITNFVTYDLGRPLHVFDVDKLKGDLTMRLARDGEEILALDGKTYSLDSEMTVIADEAGIQGIGGIMGGELSGCTEETTTVFLEVALFDPVRTAASGRRLGIHSDARYRFERGVDPRSAAWGAEVATRLILELCGGEASEVVSAGEPPVSQLDITLRPERVETLGGLALPAERQQEILARLGFWVEAGQGDTLQVRVPSWRPDVEGEACLVEEVLRIHGFDAIPQTPLPRVTALPTAVLTPRQRHVTSARTVLAWRGLNEVVTYAFMSAAKAELFGGVDQMLTLVNPISSDLDVMRPSLLPNLLEAAVRNADKGLGAASLFEIEHHYRDDSPEGQDLVAVGLRAGETPRSWVAPTRPVDLYDAKADALAVLEALGAPTANLQTTRDAPGWFHPGRSGVFRLGPQVLAVFGELHPKVLKAFGLRGTAVGFEVFLERIPLPKKISHLRPALDLSPFQPVERDFAFLVEEWVEAAAVIRAARSADKALISQVTLFDSYAGKGVEPGQKSLAIAVTLQPRDKTLTDAEIDAVGAKVVAAVEKATGGSLRG